MMRRLACSATGAPARGSSPLALEISGAVVPFPSQARAGVVVQIGRGGASSGRAVAAAAWRVAVNVRLEECREYISTAARQRTSLCPARARISNKERLRTKTRRSARGPRAAQARLPRRASRRAGCHACHHRATAKAFSRSPFRSLSPSSCA
jgi:hypothetical protein